MKGYSMVRLFLKYIFCLLILPTVAYSQSTMPVEIIITGKQPGPPMWQVKNGENTLWIFAWLSPIPKNIFWESEKVESVIADAEEYIPRPSGGTSISKLVMFNPINIIRGIRLGRRISRNDDGATLEEVLPAQLYERFAALKAEYFPRDNDIERLRPIAAAGRMVGHIQEAAGLVSADDVGKRIRRLVRRNRDIQVTEINYEMRIEGGFRDIADRVEEFMASISPELELSCFERQLTQMEEDFSEMRYRASTWAQGYVEEFRFIPLQRDEGDDCINMIATSTEQGTYEEVLTAMSSMWLDAVENALINNETTFAVLDINELLLEGGLLAQLKARGYEVIEP
ncbi:MAG: hypothetical protein COA71_03180 [SAR86 cluster bacterium]|uniref:TraB/GumN family protein n=1 Tax=SAR86 cluster bacterium TaxID=2030880 RepID=A0A2A5CF84_9GAMM|nr:MAG: hypothetical protein COA71_03180 [SAR86 cluster bacterium]